MVMKMKQGGALGAPLCLLPYGFHFGRDHNLDQFWEHNLRLPT